MADIIKALREATGSEGGFLVPDEFAARVLEYIQANVITMPDLERVQMHHEVMYIPKATAGTTAYWVPETGTITASQPAFGRITLTAKKVASLVEASTEVLEDANVSVANLIVEQMGKDIALEVDDEILNGTGGTFEGLRYTGSFTNAVDAGDSGVIGTGATSAGNISVSIISKAIDEVLKDNHQMPDVSYWHPRTIGSLRRLTDGSARPLLNTETWGSPLLAQGVVGKIYGTAVKSSTQLPINLSYGTASGETTCADALVGKSKMFGIYGDRRGLVWKTDYDIETDKYQYQTTMRAAFSIKYPDAYCLIRAIKD